MSPTTTSGAQLRAPAQHGSSQRLHNFAPPLDLVSVIVLAFGWRWFLREPLRLHALSSALLAVQQRRWLHDGEGWEEVEVEGKASDVSSAAVPCCCAGARVRAVV